MRIKQWYVLPIVVLISLMVSLTALSSRMKADTGTCGGVTVTLPFTDVMGNSLFCQIAEAYFSGLTNGTSATTYSPAQVVTREQMAAFTTRTLDQSLKRGSRRAVAKKWWTPQTANGLSLTTVGGGPQQVAFDGTDLWVANKNSGSVSQVKAGDGKLLNSWTGADQAVGVLAAKGRIFVTGLTIPNPGNLYMIDPTQPVGAVTNVSVVGALPEGIAFDGSKIWTANIGSVSIVSLNPTTVITVSTGFNRPTGMLYDEANIWVTDNMAGTLLKLNSSGAITQTITVGSGPRAPVFDGKNIWVPNSTSSSVTVVRVKDAVGNPLASAFVLATLTGNGLSNPLTAAFDGEFILVTNSVDTVSLWRATDLKPLGSFSTGDNTTNPTGVWSDGLNFWIALNGTNKLARF